MKQMPPLSPSAEKLAEQPQQKTAVAEIMAKAYELRYSKTQSVAESQLAKGAEENPSNPAEKLPFVVYFSSITCNTKRFVDKLNCRSARIPLRAADEFLQVDEPYVLAVPTYGGGSIKGAVPKQVIKFLNDPQNRAHCRGVIASGNTNFGEAYGIAGDIIAKKVGVPYMFRYELLGTPEDVSRCSEGLRKFWQTI